MKLATGKKKNFKGKNEKGARTIKKNYIKNGGQGLKNATFWIINSKNLVGFL